MNTPDRRLFLALAVVGIVWPATAHPQAGVDASSDLSAVSELLEAEVEAGTISGAVWAVATRDGVLRLEATGLQEVERAIPMTERSLFRIYSMTKPVTAVAVMMLWEEGAFGLDDPVSRWLPEFADVYVRDDDGGERPPARPITVRDLLLHTSGLSHRSAPLYRDADVRRRDIPMDRFLANIVAQPLMEDPGTRFRYSAATTVLGALVEVWAGRPFDDFLHERIFGPLEMEDTGFVVAAGDVDRFAPVYGRADDGSLVRVQIEEVPFTEVPLLLEGAVGLVSTVPDYVRFARMLARGGELDGVRLLEDATVDLMTRNGLSDEILAARPGTMGWALANVNVSLEPPYPYPSVPGEYTWNGSAGTAFWVEPASGAVIVLMTQSSPMNPNRLHQRVKETAHRALFD